MVLGYGHAGAVAGQILYNAYSGVVLCGGGHGYLQYARIAVFIYAHRHPLAVLVAVYAGKQHELHIPVKPEDHVPFDAVGRSAGRARVGGEGDIRGNLVGSVPLVVYVVVHIDRLIAGNWIAVFIPSDLKGIQIQIVQLTDPHPRRHRGERVHVLFAHLVAGLGIIGNVLKVEEILGAALQVQSGLGGLAGVVYEADHHVFAVLEDLHVAVVHHPVGAVTLLVPVAHRDSLARGVAEDYCVPKGSHILLLGLGLIRRGGGPVLIIQLYQTQLAVYYRRVGGLAVAYGLAEHHVDGGVGVGGLGALRRVALKAQARRGRRLVQGMGGVHTYDLGVVVGAVLGHVVHVIGALGLKAGDGDVELGVGLGVHLARLGLGGAHPGGHLYLRGLRLQELAPGVGVGIDLRVRFRVGVAAGHGHPVDRRVLVNGIAQCHGGGLGVGLEHLAHGELGRGHVLGGDRDLLHL